MGAQRFALIGASQHVRCPQRIDEGTGAFMAHHRGRHWRGWITCAALALVWMGCAPAHALLVSDAQNHVLSSSDLSYREDEAGVLSVREVLAPAQAQWFRPLSADGRIPNFGYRSTTLWLKAELDVLAPAPALWLLQIANPRLDSIEVFLVGPGDTLSRTSGGDALPFSQRPVPHRHHVFPLNLRGPGIYTVVLRIRSTSSLQIPVTLLQPQALLSQDHRAYSLLSLYFGLMAGLLAYNFLLYVAIKDTVYLHYIAFVAAMSLAQLANTGFGPQFVWPERPQWNDLASNLGYAACGLTAILFARRFLHSRLDLPRLDRVLRGLLWVWGAYIILLPGMGLEYAGQLLIGLALLTIPPLLMAGVDRLRARRTGARYFLLAWSMLMLGVFIEAMVSLGWLSAHPLLAHPVMLGAALEMLLLSFALADRFKSERRAKESALSMGLREQLKKQEAERLSIEKSRFLAAVSHDLRQPLFALSLTAQSLHARAPELEPLVQQMKSALESANGLLDSIMTMARLETGSLRANRVDFSVQSLVERVDLTFQPQALEKGLRWVLTPSIARVHSDPVLLERMLNNLVSNAVRFTRTGGVVVSCRRSGPCLLLQVWDTGPGIDPADHEAIFTEYFRGEPETASDNGVGLGLFIVKNCAAMLDIGLALRSVPGRGSCFSLRIPLAHTSLREPTPERALDPSPQPGPTPSPTDASV